MAGFGSHATEHEVLLQELKVHTHFEDTAYLGRYFDLPSFGNRIGSMRSTNMASRGMYRLKRQVAGLVCTKKYTSAHWAQCNGRKPNFNVTSSSDIVDAVA